MKKIITITLTTLTFLFFAFAMYIMIFATLAVRNNEQFKLFGHAYSVVGSDSMIGDLPDSLKKGDIIIISDKPYEQVEVGDVIVYHSEEYSIQIVHRVILVYESGELKTKGDANSNQDTENVTSEKYIGTVTNKISFLNVGLLALDFRGIIFLSLTLVFLFILIKEIIHIVRNLIQKSSEDLSVLHEEEKKKMIEQEKQKLYEEILEEEKKKQPK